MDVRPLSQRGISSGGLILKSMSGSIVVVWVVRLSGVGIRTEIFIYIIKYIYVFEC